MDRARNPEDSISPLSFQDPSVALGLETRITESQGVEVGAPWGGGAEAPTRVAILEPGIDRSAPSWSAPIGTGQVNWLYAPLKRLVDISICLLILPIVLPVAGLIALAIKADSRGPVIFRQTRVGRGGRPFTILKFRTLRADHDQEVDRAYMVAFIQGRTNELLEGGERVVNKPIEPTTVTRVGRVLRKSSLDELPQIVNVLNGEMSLVGPRPNVPWEVDAYLEWHRERLEVTPGITGLAQVRGRSCVTFDTIAASDIEYVHRRSLILDLDILWRTAACLFSADGAG